MNSSAVAVGVSPKLLGIVLLILFSFIAACGTQPTPAPTTTPPQPQPTDTAAPAPTTAASATPTEEPAPTETANPTATNTPEPSATPETPTVTATSEPVIEEFSIPAGSHPHDVAPDPESDIVWYTAQASGELGRLDPTTGETRHIPLGDGSRPHGVIIGPDGAAWITDGGLNAIVRVDPETEAVETFPLPASTGYANLNTATFDDDNVLWFTGQSGIYGRLDPDVGEVEVFQSPRGSGPYGIDSTPAGEVYFASLAGSYMGYIDTETAEVTVLEPPTAGQGARRVWSDSQGRLWVSEWNAGQLARYTPETQEWQEWPIPGDNPMPYAVYVDERDVVWLSDFGSNALVRFEPTTEEFTVFTIPSANANVRQLLGRPGEVWGAESGTDKLIVVRTR